MKTGISVVAHNRPKYFKECINFILKNVKVDFLMVYNDGSSEEFENDFQEIYKTLPPYVKINHAKENKGVAFAKNVCLKSMYEAKCDYFFTCEDDILLLNQNAVDKYIEASKITGFEHFNFALHGPKNREDPAVYKDKHIAYYSHCVGAWSMYTPNVIDKVGYLDENFPNCYEHAEYTKRIGDAGLTGPWGLFVDVVDSDKYMTEIKGSIESSTIRNNEKWEENIKKGLAYWESKDGCGIPQL